MSLATGEPIVHVPFNDRDTVDEHGKAYREARGELRRGIESVEVACGIPSMMQAGTLESAAPHRDESAAQKPVGVFAAVTPFNFPGRSRSGSSATGRHAELPHSQTP